MPREVLRQQNIESETLKKLSIEELQVKMKLGLRPRRYFKQKL